jgi:hypothetical protein
MTGATKFVARWLELIDPGLLSFEYYLWISNTMANNVDMILAVKNVPRNWRLIVRVVRLWGVLRFNTPNKFQSLEFVLMDSLEFLACDKKEKKNYNFSSNVDKWKDKSLKSHIQCGGIKIQL